MTALDQLLGHRPAARNDPPPRVTPFLSGFAESPPYLAGVAEASPSSGQATDEQVVARYRYLLRAAPPEAIEQAHAEAFAQLTAEQRRLVLESLSRDLPPHERTDRADPQSLARMATRAELRRPGALEGAFGGIGLGGFLAANFLGTIAGVVVGSAIADAIFDDGQGADAADGGYDGGDFGFDAPGDFGGDFGGGEF